MIDIDMCRNLYATFMRLKDKPEERGVRADDEEEETDYGRQRKKS